ncbi:RNA polymerase sigma factor domain protein, partial [Chlamydia psittaci 84-8471/1]
MLKEEDAYLESLLLALKQNNLSKEETAKLNDDLEKCRIRTQAYLRCFHCRHNVTEDFGEVVFKAYDSFLQLEQQINDLKVRAERNKFAAAKLDAAKRRLYKREVAAGRTLEEFKKDVRMLQRWMDKSQ